MIGLEPKSLTTPGRIYPGVRAQDGSCQVRQARQTITLGGDTDVLSQVYGAVYLYATLESLLEIGRRRLRLASSAHANPHYERRYLVPLPCAELSVQMSTKAAGRQPGDDQESAFKRGHHCARYGQWL
jgi:hypothetical protein